VAYYGYPPQYGYPGYDPNYAFMQQQQQQAMRPPQPYVPRRNSGPRGQQAYFPGSDNENMEQLDGQAGVGPTDAVTVEESANDDSGPSTGASLPNNEDVSSAGKVPSPSDPQCSAADSQSTSDVVQTGDRSSLPVEAVLVDSKNSLEAPSGSCLNGESTAAATVAMQGVTIRDDYEQMSNNISTAGVQKSNASSAEWTRKKVESVKAPSADADDTWRRDGPVVDKDDGVSRYTKMDLLQLNTLKKIPPQEIRALYPHHSKVERFARVPKGMKLILLEDATPHEDEIKIFSGDKVFKFDASKHSNIDDPEVIIRKATLILNQLSENNFDRLSNDFMAVGIDKHELMGRVVDMLVLKAQTEENFCGMYANLAKKLSTTWSTALGSTTAGSEEAGATLPDLGQTFRNRLLERAKEEFDIDRTATIAAIRNNTDIPVEDREEKEIKQKKKYSGMMRFVGELYAVDLIKSRTIEECIDILFKTRVEEDLVCLNKLVQTVGPKYDVKRSNKLHLDKLFADMEEVIAAHTSSRIRFLMKDLRLLRQEGWQQRGKEPEKLKASEPSPAGGNRGGATPKNSSTPRFGSGSGTQDARRQGSMTPTGASSPAPDEWSTVGGAKKNLRPVTPVTSASTSNGIAANSGKGGSTKGFSSLVSPARKPVSNAPNAGDKSPKREARAPRGTSAKEQVAAEKSAEADGRPVKLELAIPMETADSAPSPVCLVGIDGNVDKETLKKV
jgi:hypothetical protein